MMSRKQLAIAFGSVLALTSSVAQSQQSADEEPPPPLSFFVTSVGAGKGADLGGLEGADAHCQTLAEAAAANEKTWQAYLSTQAVDGQAAVNARDRIGEGPWHNAKGALIASDLDSLHYDNSNINYTGALNELGNTINSGGMGNAPNEQAPVKALR